MINYIFLKSITGLVNIVDAHFGIVGIDFSATLVNREKYRFYTGSGTRHKACSSGRSDCQTGDVATTMTAHSFHEFGISLSETVDIRVVFFSVSIEDFKGSTFFGQSH